MLYPPQERATRSGQKPGKRSRGGGRGRSKKIKLEETMDNESVTTAPIPAPVAKNEPPPDANMVLRYTYGVNAWKNWVIQKNAQLERASSTRGGRLKLFKTDILSCTADELNYSLCLFVKEVRKPNGEEYAPDSIYYLCLGKNLDFQFYLKSPMCTS